MIDNYKIQKGRAMNKDDEKLFIDHGVETELTKLHNTIIPIAIADSYFDLADEYLEKILEDNKRFEERWSSPDRLEIEVKAIKGMKVEKLNDEIIPICFLYRHYLELRLKDFYNEHSNNTEEQKALFFKKANHSLLSLLSIFDKIINDNVMDDEVKKKYSIVRKLIEEFDQKDPSGEKFRYAKAKNGTPHYEETYFTIDVAHLKERMNFIRNFFEDDIEPLFGRKSN